MGTFVSFNSLDDSWFQRRQVFEVVLYHSVIRQSSPEKLPSLYADVEREIAEHLFYVDPDRYPEYGGSLGMIEFDKYPIEERREFLSATKKGVEEIRSVETPEEHSWSSDYRDRYVRLGEELIEMMVRSLALVEGTDGSDAPSPAISGESAP